ncbi:hypothetical protein ACFL20_10365 [Spirochaetota bacterium]
MRNRFFNIIVFVIILSFSSIICLAQGDSKDSTKKDSKINSTKNTETLKKTETVEKSTLKKVETKVVKKVEKKEPVKNAKTVKTENSRKRESGVNVDGSLLKISEGYFKYERIPEIKIKKRRVEIDNTVNDAVKIPENIDLKDKKKEEKKGLFGISKGKTDVIAKVALVLFIFLIFILYRIRAKSSSRNVLRSFQKK